MTHNRLVLLSSVFVFAMSSATMAVASNPNAGNNNGPQNNTNNITTHGGAGGAGGAGGVGIGFGGNATSGAVATTSVNAMNRNNVHNTNANMNNVHNTNNNTNTTSVNTMNRNNVRNTNTNMNNAHNTNNNTNVARGGNAHQGQVQGQNQSISGSGNATINNNVPANTTNETRFSGSYTVRNTPDVYAPALSGGANPCVVGVSGGGAVAGFGISFGMTRNDEGCERRNMAALLHNMGERDVAQEVLCETESVRQARLRVGRPCYSDRVNHAATSTVTAAATAQVVQSAAVQHVVLNPVVAVNPPQPVAVTPVVSEATVNLVPRNGAPAFCSVPGLQLNLYPECN